MKIIIIIYQFCCELKFIFDYRFVIIVVVVLFLYVCFVCFWTMMMILMMKSSTNWYLHIM